MIPEILILHRAHVDKSDVQEMYGVRVTRPMRTIIDLLRSSQVDWSQLKLAVNDAIRRGLETQKSIACRPMIYNARFVSWPGSQHDARNKILQNGRRLSHRAGDSLTSAREAGTDLQRLRRQVAFDRFLARMFSNGSKASYPWVLKGGYGMELRTHSARTTKDIDLTLHDGARLSREPGERREQVRTMLQDAAAVAPGEQIHLHSPWL